MFLATVAGAFVGTAIAGAFFSRDAGQNGGGPDETTGDGSPDTVADGTYDDRGGDLGGGDFGGF